MSNFTTISRPWMATLFSELTEDLHDTVDPVDSLFFNWIWPISDTTAVTDSTSFDIAALLGDTVDLSDDVDVISLINELLESDVALSDAVTIVWPHVIGDTVVLTDSVAEFILNVLNLADTLATTDSVDDIHIALEAIGCSLVIADSLYNVASEATGDSLSLSEQIQGLGVLYNLITDTVAPTDSHVDSLILSLSTNSSVSLSDDLLQNLLASEDTGDSILLIGSLNIQDEEYLAVVMNISNRAVTEYTNYKFNSFAQRQNKYFAASSSKIYILSGATDDGSSVLSSAQTGLLDFGITQRKRIPECYLGYTSDGDLVLKMYTVESNGVKTERWYELTRTKTVVDTDRIDLPKGVDSRYYQFELANKDGGDFEVDSIDLYPAILSRRLR